MSNVVALAGQVCNGMGCEQVEVEKGFVAGLIATFGILVLLIVVLAMLGLAFWIWMLIDAIKRDELSYKELDQGEKNIWLVVMIASLFFSFNLIAALVYYFMIYRKAKQQEALSASKK